MEKFPSENRLIGEISRPLQEPKAVGEALRKLRWAKVIGFL